MLRNIESINSLNTLSLHNNQVNHFWHVPKNKNYLIEKSKEICEARVDLPELPEDVSEIKKGFEKIIKTLMPSDIETLETSVRWTIRQIQLTLKIDSPHSNDHFLQDRGRFDRAHEIRRINQASAFIHALAIRLINRKFSADTDLKKLATEEKKSLIDLMSDCAMKAIPIFPKPLIFIEKENSSTSKKNDVTQFKGHATTFSSIPSEISLKPNAFEDGMIELAGFFIHEWIHASQYKAIFEMKDYITAGKWKEIPMIEAGQERWIWNFEKESKLSFSQPISALLPQPVPPPSMRAYADMMSLAKTKKATDIAAIFDAENEREGYFIQWAARFFAAKNPVFNPNLNKSTKSIQYNLVDLFSEINPMECGDLQTALHRHIEQKIGFTIEQFTSFIPGIEHFNNRKSTVSDAWYALLKMQSLRKYITNEKDLDQLTNHLLLHRYSPYAFLNNPKHPSHQDAKFFIYCIKGSLNKKYSSVQEFIFNALKEKYKIPNTIIESFYKDYIDVFRDQIDSHLSDLNKRILFETALYGLGIGEGTNLSNEKLALRDYMKKRLL